MMVRDGCCVDAQNSETVDNDSGVCGCVAVVGIRKKIIVYIVVVLEFMWPKM